MCIGNNKVLLLRYNQFSMQSLAPFLLLICIIPLSTSIFCSSSCISSNIVCYDETDSGCLVCARHIYNLESHLLTPTTSSCVLQPQTQLIAYDFKPNIMDYSGYVTTQTTPRVCGNYTFTGTYVAHDYLSKNFTDFPTNHYAVVVKFSLGHMGNWTQNDTLLVQFKDGQQTVNYEIPYYCYENETICYGDVECIRGKDYYLPHNSSYLFVNFSALTTETDPNIQFWTVKEIIVAAKLCHPYCSTCFGASNTQCLSCESTYLLQGNVCLKKCQLNFFAVASTRTCESQCPIAFYADTSNGNRICLPCVNGCALCSNSTGCMVLAGKQAHQSDIWMDKLEFWVLLMVILASLLFYFVYRMIKRSIPRTEIEEKMVEQKELQQKDKQNKSHKEVELQSQMGSKQEMTNVQLNSSMNRNESLPIFAEAEQIRKSLDLQGGESLWFNELAEVESSKATKSKPKRKQRPTTTQQVADFHLDQ